MIRTQEEILTRFKKVDDFLGVEQADLIACMTFENAKKYLNDEYIEKINKGEETWEQLTDPKKEILDYLEFAYDKALGQRGLNAGRSLLHFKTWIWLDDDEFYNEILPLINHYTNNGIPALDKIAEHYGYKQGE